MKTQELIKVLEKYPDAEVDFILSDLPNFPGDMAVEFVGCFPEDNRLKIYATVPLLGEADKVRQKIEQQKAAHQERARLALEQQRHNP